jgi:hypothetical protein
MMRLTKFVSVDHKDAIEHLFEALMRAQSEYDQAEADEQPLAKERLVQALGDFSEFCTLHPHSFES